MDYLFETLGECIQEGFHLMDCDKDGFCNYCGHLENEEFEDDFINDE
ncbi:MAG: hypothetical protein JXQ23_12130 [Clostridia bacterium]|nr:hypothetical protein [Clostridia bacterium]